MSGLSVRNRGCGDDPGLALDPAIHPPVELVEGRPERIHHQTAQKTITDHEIHCQGTVKRGNVSTTCGKLLAELAGRPWQISCPRCKAPNRSPGFEGLATDSDRPPEPKMS